MRSVLKRKSERAARRGFTMMELMLAIGIMSIVAGVLFALAGTLAQATRAQEARIAASDDVRSGIVFLVRNVRQAATSTVSWDGLPGPTLSYCVAADLDGNGSAIDIGMDLELSPLRTLSRDATDLNNDGQTLTQLVMEQDGQVKVVTNGLLLDEDTNGNNTFDAGEDRNGNGQFDRGLWFERAGQGIRVTIQTERSSGPHGSMSMSNLVETVVPRN